MTASPQFWGTSSELSSWWLCLRNATMSSIRHVPELYKYMINENGTKKKYDMITTFCQSRSQISDGWKIQLTPNFFVLNTTINTHPSNCTMTRRSSIGALWATTWGNPCLCLSFSPAPCGGPSQCATALKFASAQNVTLQKFLSVIKQDENPMMFLLVIYQCRVPDMDRPKLT